jgi:hypothetical protein
MPLLDADTQPLLCVMTQKFQYQADAMGMAVHNLTGVRWIAARLSRPSFKQEAAWGTQGISGEYACYTYDGDIDNGMFLFNDQDNRLFRVIGPRNKSYSDGGLSTFWAYPVQEDTSQVIPSTFTDQLPSKPLLPPLGSAPSPPSVVVSGATPNVTLTWGTRFGVAWYNVWRGTASGAEAYLATVGAGVGTYNDIVAPLPGPNFYVVYAQNQYGTAKSNEVSA